MNTHPLRTAGLALAGFAIAVNIPFTILVETFRYDAILREPAGVVLRSFHAGGPGLVLAWLGFALCALAFLPVAVAVDAGIRAAGRSWGALAGFCAAGAAIAQAVGLSRWVFAVPGIAAAYVDPAASPAQRDALIAIYQVLHQFAGVAIGEHIGQTLTAGWTFLVARALWAGGIGPRWLGAAGFALTALWVLGQGALLDTVGFRTGMGGVTKTTFVLWEVWLLALAVVWVRLRSAAGEAQHPRPVGHQPHAVAAELQA
ncbi:MAG: DUF4386 domain-containing protein [Alphaproteobacteria bacterium]|nr:DUF4386 domain-containing protein [Alphaproteobacteria bacterium]